MNERMICAKAGCHKEVVPQVQRRGAVKRFCSRSCKITEYNNGIRGVRSLQYRYGISPEKRIAMLAVQDGCCAICGTMEPGKLGWHIDHDHRFKRRDPRGHRGVLCAACNMGIGHMGDDPNVLRKAIAYLERHASTVSAAAS